MDEDLRASSPLGAGPQPADSAWRWRIGAASALSGIAALVAAVRAELGLGWSIALLALVVVGIALALRGVRHRVDQRAARRSVFYGGEGATAWLLVLMLGIGVIPSLLVGVLPQGPVRTLVIGALAVGVTAATHGILAAATTTAPQPAPEPVPVRS